MNDDKWERIGNRVVVVLVCCIIFLYAVGVIR